MFDIIGMNVIKSNREEYLVTYSCDGRITIFDIPEFHKSFKMDMSDRIARSFLPKQPRKLLDKTLNELHGLRTIATIETLLGSMYLITYTRLCELKIYLLEFIKNPIESKENNHYKEINLNLHFSFYEPDFDLDVLKIDYLKNYNSIVINLSHSTKILKLQQNLKYGKKLFFRSSNVCFDSRYGGLT